HAGQWAPPKLFVNVFDGGPRTTVRYRVEGGRVRSMERTVRIDPFMKRLYRRREGTSAAVARPEPSSHLWSAPLPSDLAPGAHTVTVTSNNEFGRTDTTSTVVEVQAPAEAPGPQKRRDK
ncbi:MAG: calcineurin-like phosphoesterase C-terminal domain-containing protein, partial [Salinibacter sp.]